MWVLMLKCMIFLVRVCVRLFLERLCVEEMSYLLWVVVSSLVRCFLFVRLIFGGRLLRCWCMILVYVEFESLVDVVLSR